MLPMLLTVFAFSGMAHRNFVVLLLLSAAAVVVVGHTHEEANLGPGEDVAGLQGKTALVGESTGEKLPLH